MNENENERENLVNLGPGFYKKGNIFNYLEVAF